MSQEQRKHHPIRRAGAMLLAAVLLLSGIFPGRVLAAEDIQTVETEMTIPETTVETTEELTETTTQSTEETALHTLPETETAVLPEPTETTQAATIPMETAEATEEATIPEETAEATQAATIPEETEEATQAATIPGETEAVMQPTEETMETEPESEETGPQLFAAAEEAYGAIQRTGSRETPMAATAENSVTSLGSSSGIKFRIFNYTNGKDADGNYITDGGVNDNGLDGYFNFRGSSYENSGADGKRVCDVVNTDTDVDGFTANHATVLATLDADGYPVFDGSRGGGPQKSLGYLFGSRGNGVTAYTAGNTPLQRNDKGQYYYDSAVNAVDFDTASGRFIVRKYKERGKTTAGQGTGQYYDFFPFTYWDGTTKINSETNNWYNYDNTVEVDYWFGMTMEASFSMPQDGKVDGEDMIFSFSGDDDVWVFIDDVLVLDLGGTHGVASGSINFATGEVKQYLDWNGTTEASSGTSYPTRLETRFQTAGRIPNGGWSGAEKSHGKIFADYSEHTITFFYLERATSCANCKIRFNMPILPTGKLTVEKQVEGDLTEHTKEHQYGFALVRKTEAGEQAVPGVRYDVIDSGSGSVAGSGTTGPDGGFVLKAGQRAEFDLTAGKTYLVRETGPDNIASPVRCTVNGEVQPMADESGAVIIDPDVPVEVIVYNRLDTVGFAVRKQVKGNMGDRGQLFSFTAGLYTAQTGEKIAFPEPETGELYTVQDGKAHFQLQHDAMLSFDDIPLGACVILTEIRAEGYETKYQTGETTAAGNMAVIDALTEPVEVTFVNTREVQIETGIMLDTAPFGLMATGSAAGLLLPRKRRKKE